MTTYADCKRYEELLPHVLRLAGDTYSGLKRAGDGNMVHTDHVHHSLTYGGSAIHNSL